MVDPVHKAPEDNPDHPEITATQEKKVKISSKLILQPLSSKTLGYESIATLWIQQDWIDNDYLILIFDNIRRVSS